MRRGGFVSRARRCAGDAVIIVGCAIVWLGTKFSGYHLEVRLPEHKAVAGQKG